MPYAAPRICPRCGRLVQKGFRCTCRPAFAGSTHPGNTRRMAALRKAKLRADPICEWGRGCRLLAIEVDHIIPLAAGGARYDWANLMSLCHDHHAEKTTRDALHGKRRKR
jgi:5-methylcytosine-specific restriction protein A